MEIKTKDYSVWYEPNEATVFFKGFLRLDGMEAYQPIINLLNSASDGSDAVTLDLQELEFLNSSGISMLSMFVVALRNKGSVNLILKGSNKVLWQTKSLRNLQRLMPSIVLELC
ncbi:MAG TPA: hypothetical protein IGS53_05885 [Leptolyngbyaceae cyanobacterium M33_DOE_097]|uniref:STAS domain-containing protein n=1 Tax=Oscillatoriales cyanobacterium SpSt-418 TaxID=2282169 RepID=A0A7C3KBL0_9CYAN|nr:hypothetical protein [Leptolyngbyaceae cyanobacterium M33_DOE_097]